MIGASAIDRTMSFVTVRATDTPRKTSAPSMASARGAGRAVGGEPRLVGVHPFGAATVDNAPGVGEHDVLAPHAQVDEELATGNRRRPGAADRHPDLADVLAGELECVEQRGAADDRRPVLVVVEDRDVHRYRQPP